MLCKLIVYSLIKTWTLKTRLFEPHAILLLLQFLQVLPPITADQKWKKINKWIRDFLSRKRKKIKNVYWPRCGFRGGDLVTCHPLFFAHDFTQPNFVTEPLFPTSVSKFIRKYLLSRPFSQMYSSCCNTATYIVKFSDNFFQE